MLKNAILAVGLLGAVSSYGATIAWTDWTSATIGSAGSAAGNLGGVSVSYSGDVATPTQTGNAVGTYYYTEPNPSLEPYTANGVIGNLPGTSLRDIIAIDTANSGSLNTISFSAPVYNPVMLLVSLGRDNLPVYYDFDAALSLSLLSSGEGYWGGGANSLTLAGNTITGVEGHGAIQINGWVSSIQWATRPDEYWHGFTLGAPAGVPDAINGFGALLAAMGSLIGFRRLAK